MNSQMKKVLCFVVVLSAFYNTGCQYDPYAHQYLRKKPKESDLVGTWVSGKGDIVTFYDDGTALGSGTELFQVATEETCIEPEKDISGTWKVVRVQNEWYAIEVHWQNRGKYRLYDTIVILNTEPYQLLRQLDDPDLGHVLILKRKDGVEKE